MCLFIVRYCFSRINISQTNANRRDIDANVASVDFAADCLQRYLLDLVAADEVYRSIGGENDDILCLLNASSGNSWRSDIISIVCSFVCFRTCFSIFVLLKSNYRFHSTNIWLK